MRAKLEEEVKELRGALAAQKLASLSGDDVLDADDPMLSGLGGRASASLVSAESLEDLRRKFSEAEGNYHQAINLINSENPSKNPKIISLYHSNLGVLYHRWKKEGEAIKFYQEALLYDKNNANARDNLNRLFKAK